MVRSLQAIGQELDGSGWPDVLGARCCLKELDAWANGRVEALQRSDRSSERLSLALAREDEAACLAYLRGGEREEELRRVAPSTLRRLHAFLLKHWLFSEADELAKADKTLPSHHRHLTTMYIGVLSGPFLMADMGTAWNWVAAPGHTGEFLTTTGFALLGSVAVVLGSASRVLSGHGFGQSLRRIVPTWGTSLALSLATSLIALYTLKGGSAVEKLPESIFDWRSVCLWTSMSMFFGVFLGVLSQGRNVAGD